MSRSWRCLWTTASTLKTWVYVLFVETRKLENRISENSVAWCISCFQSQASLLACVFVCLWVCVSVCLCVCVSVCVSQFSFSFKSMFPPLPLPSPRALAARLSRSLRRACACVRRKALAPRATRWIVARTRRATAAVVAVFCGVPLIQCMYVCIYRRTDAPQLYLGHAARVTWARAFAPVPRRQTIQTEPIFVSVGDTSFFICLMVGWLTNN